MGGGKRPADLRSISRESPTPEEVAALREAMSSLSAPPLVVAILGAALLEHDIEQLLRPHFVHN
jgi:hypothetical protein